MKTLKLENGEQVSGKSLNAIWSELAGRLEVSGPRVLIAAAAWGHGDPCPPYVAASLTDGQDRIVDKLGRVKTHW